MAAPPYAIQNSDVFRQIQEPLAMPGGPLQVSIDPTQASLVYPLNQGWLGLQVHQVRYLGQSINGASYHFRPVQNPGGNLYGPVVTTTTYRIYDQIVVGLAGGAVTPIDVYVRLEHGVGGNAFIWHLQSCVNPGYVFFSGPILCARDVNLDVFVGAGGVGDTADFYTFCRSAPEGVEIPQIY